MENSKPSKTDLRMVDNDKEKIEDADDPRSEQSDGGGDEDTDIDDEEEANEGFVDQGTAEENAERPAPAMRSNKVAPTSTKHDGGDARRMDNNPFMGMSPSVLDMLQFLPPEALRTVKIKPNRKSRIKSQPDDPDKPRGPVAAKVIFIKKPADLEDEEPVIVPQPLNEGPQKVEETPLPPPPTKPASPTEQDLHPISLLFFMDSVERMLKETQDDKDVEAKLNDLMAAHRGDKLRKLKNAAKGRMPNYKFGDMMNTLENIGIPCPIDVDFARLHGLHSRWDPDGTVVEYFSPMLRSFIPVNMRGRYRGCWPSDTCMKGLNISKISPKRDALEGFVARGRHANVQQKYDEMAEVAADEAHLDYLIEMQAFHAETLPIPIFYDMLHLGIQVANESLRILVQEEGFPPHNEIFSSQLHHAEQLRRKIQLYGALGLETLDSRRKGLGEYLPHWLKTRDEIIREVLASRNSMRSENLGKKEREANEREKMRRQTIESRASTTLPKTDQSRGVKFGSGSQPPSAPNPAAVVTTPKTYYKGRMSKVFPQPQLPKGKK